MLPVTCLVIGDAVLGAEVRSGTFTFTWMSPVPTWQIAVGRWLGGTIAAAGALAIAFALAAVVAGAPESAGADRARGRVRGRRPTSRCSSPSGASPSGPRCGRSPSCSSSSGCSGAALSGIAQLTPSWEARAAFVGLTDAQRDLVREGIPHGTGALVRLCFISAVALVLTSAKLRTLKLTGSTD